MSVLATSFTAILAGLREHIGRFIASGVVHPTLGVRARARPAPWDSAGQAALRARQHAILALVWGRLYATAHRIARLVERWHDGTLPRRRPARAPSRAASLGRAARTRCAAAGSAG